MNSVQRHNGRLFDELRHVRFSYNVFEYAAGSIFFELGKTKILCAVHIQHGVPPFMRGKSSGWLTAEYAMLPAATVERTPREIALMRKNGRNTEISRLISRVLRSIVILDALGEQTITIDCDVVQADGGTRTASITSACLALQVAQERWLQNNIITTPLLRDDIVAVAVGVLNGNVLLDPDFGEDSAMDADFNFVVTRTGNVVEIQGGAEKKPISWELFDAVRTCALHGVQKLFTVIEQQKRIVSSTDQSSEHKIVRYKKQAALFSLQNRLPL